MVIILNGEKPKSCGECQFIREMWADPAGENLTWRCFFTREAVYRGGAIGKNCPIVGDGNQLRQL